MSDHPETDSLRYFVRDQDKDTQLDVAWKMAEELERRLYAAQGQGGQESATAPSQEGHAAGPAPAAAAVDSRSRLRRIAAQRGEPAPEFTAAPAAGETPKSRLSVRLRKLATFGETEPLLGINRAILNEAAREIESLEHRLREVLADLDVLCTVIRTGATPPERNWLEDTYRKTAMRAMELHQRAEAAESRAAGMVMVPREPTKEMLEAGTANSGMMHFLDELDGKPALQWAWEAMLATAQKEETTSRKPE